MIDENSIELHAMGRLTDESLRQHLDTCDFCRVRVAEHRAWIDDLKWALQKFQQTKENEPQKGDAITASRPDDP
jgi:hypothetical protein